MHEKIQKNVKLNENYVKLKGVTSFNSSIALNFRTLQLLQKNYIYILKTWIYPFILTGLSLTKASYGVSLQCLIRYGGELIDGGKFHIIFSQ